MNSLWYTNIILVINVQATILAVGLFSEDPCQYGARPFAISGTCKREEVLSQKQLLDTAREALARKAQHIGGKLYSFASDGDSRRRKATVMLTMISKIAADSQLQANLGDLELFDYCCGSDEETADFEYKHLLKHLHNTLLQMKCTTLDGVVLTTQLLKSHLLELGTKDVDGINALLSPKDKQDVKLMYDLLSSITTLPHASSSSTLAVQKTRDVLQLLGQLYTHLLEAYTNINLSLAEQLKHLSAAAHLVIAFYKKERGSVMPSQLHFDLIFMVKNAYCCVAKAQRDNPNGKFFIILLGTNPLEILFGKV